MRIRGKKEESTTNFMCASSAKKKFEIIGFEELYHVENCKE
jgi:hypothetical protein